MILQRRSRSSTTTAICRRITRSFMTTVKKISPMLAVADMEETVSFYTTVLGFSVPMTSPEFSIIERDGSTIFLMKAADDDVMMACSPKTDPSAMRV